MAETDPRSSDQKAINWLGVVLTVYLCCLLAYLVRALVTGEVQADFRDVVIGIVGFVTAKLSTIYDFCFGTSSSNKKLVETSALQAATAKAAQEALAPIVAAAAPGARPADAGVVLQPGDHVDVAAAPSKPDGMTQQAWDALTDDQKKAQGKK